MAVPALLATEEKVTANLDCIHCGLCLSVCPTYLHLGSEVDSPRGRIYLINAMSDGRVSPASAVFDKHMQLCLECRACETACPSGVRFSTMMNEARASIRSHKPLSRSAKLLRRLIFERILPSRRALHWIFRTLRFYQASGLQAVVRNSGVLGLLPSALKNMEALLPRISKSATYGLPAAADSIGRARVSFFAGCIMPELFPTVHEATIRVLRRNGVSICLPPGQTCCGALHLHDGEMDMARRLARENIEAFERDNADFIVVNAAGCGAMLKEYGQLLGGEPAYAERAMNFSRRVRDIAEFLDEIGLDKKPGRLSVKVAYDDPCHLIHGQGIKTPPRRLLRAIPELELVELRDSDRCCGSAGIYNITQPELSARILDEKISNIARTGAQVVASGNPGCLLQIEAGLRAKNLAVRVCHPIELLDQAYADTAGDSHNGNE